MNKIPIGSRWQSRRDTWRLPVTVVRHTAARDGTALVVYASQSGSLNSAGVGYFLANRNRVI